MDAYLSRPSWASFPLLLEQAGDYYPVLVDFHAIGLKGAAMREDHEQMDIRSQQISPLEAVEGSWTADDLWAVGCLRSSSGDRC